MPHQGLLHGRRWAHLIQRCSAADLGLHGEPGRLQRLKRQVEAELCEEVHHLAAEPVCALERLVWPPANAGMQTVCPFVWALRSALHNVANVKVAVS